MTKLKHLILHPFNDLKDVEYSNIAIIYRIIQLSIIPTIILVVLFWPCTNSIVIEYGYRSSQQDCSILTTPVDIQNLLASVLSVSNNICDLKPRVTIKPQAKYLDRLLMTEDCFQINETVNCPVSSGSGYITSSLLPVSVGFNVIGDGYDPINVFLDDSSIQAYYYPQTSDGLLLQSEMLSFGTSPVWFSGILYSTRSSVPIEVRSYTNQKLLMTSQSVVTLFAGFPTSNLTMDERLELSVNPIMVTGCTLVRGSGNVLQYNPQLFKRLFAYQCVTRLCVDPYTLFGSTISIYGLFLKLLSFILIMVIKYKFVKVDMEMNVDSTNKKDRVLNDM